MKKLNKGDRAPAFSGTDQHGKTISLDDFRGKQLILYFYPKDDTPGCTAEACNLRDNYEELIRKGFSIVGVSPDGMNSHRKFTDKYQLPFSLLSDEKASILKAYGAWGKKTMYGRTYEGVLRTTFVISGDGIIEEVFEKVDTKDHTRQILDTLKK